jgi:hypothetical protein
MGEALGGFPEQLDREVEAIEVGFVTGLDVLDRASKDEVIGIGFGPEPDEVAFTAVTLTGHG